MHPVQIGIILDSCLLALDACREKCDIRRCPARTAGDSGEDLPEEAVSASSARFQEIDVDIRV
jgi:hypothetical protein